MEGSVALKKLCEVCSDLKRREEDTHWYHSGSPRISLQTTTRDLELSAKGGCVFCYIIYCGLLQSDPEVVLEYGVANASNSRSVSISGDYECPLRIKIEDDEFELYVHRGTRSPKNYRLKLKHISSFIHSSVSIFET